MVEMMVAIAILCGAVMALIVVLARTGDLAGDNADRINAAARLDRLLEDVRHGALQVPRAGEITSALPAGESPLRQAQYVIRTEPWADGPELVKVTVTLRWQTGSRRHASATAVTLVRAKRLKFTEANP
jgi:type II secretory pathway pseudopilin PulG